MRAETYEIAGVYLRIYLAGLRKISGPQYANLLKGAGLEQYGEKYPAPDFNVAAKGSQLIELNRAVLEMLGEELYSLFLRNLGREFGRNLANLPHFADLAQKPGFLTDQAGLFELAKVHSKLSNATAKGELITCWTGQDAKEVLTVYQDCLHCAHRTKIDKPCCFGVVAQYKELLYNLTKTHYGVEETRCGPMHGEQDCHFTLRLP